jgi:hypothetical protein
MHNPRHPQRSADDGQCIVPSTHRHVAPGGEIVRFAPFVNGHRGAAIEQDERAARSGELNGLKETI